jgi:pimeloyl-ACP methyl ester carboxylesterase
MNVTERVWRMSRDIAGVLPRAHAAVSVDDGWTPLSPDGVRQLGEVLLDELALTGFTLTASPPELERSIDSCAAAVDELGALGMSGAHAEPDPLRIGALRRRRFGRVSYEQLTFEHDPRLPGALAEFGGPATAVAHLCRQGDDRRPWLVWVHGAGQGQPIDLLFSRARRLQQELGYNIALPVQPGCGVRQSQWPAYPNMDPLNNVAGLLRVVSEVRAVVRWLRPQASAVAVAGVSMGSPVAGLVSHLEEVDAVAVYTPIFDLNTMIAAHLGRWGPSVRDTIDLLTSDAVRAMTSVVDYHAVQPTPPPQRRLVVGAWHDRMAMREPAQVLHERWGGKLYWHRGSHVGHLFARGVQAASERLLRDVCNGGCRREAGPGGEGHEWQ